MKVQNNSIYMGADIQSARQQEGQRSDSKKGNNIDGRSLHTNIDPIAAKREEARKKAMKIVGNAFSNELKIDDDLNARRERVRTLQKDMGDANRYIKETEEKRADLKDTYGIEADSQEEEDLKLLEKEIRYKIPGSDVHFEAGDLERLAQIKKNGLTEYQQRSLEMFESEVPYIKTAYENNREIMTENQIISATNLERLKSHPMLDANKEAEAIMDAANKEIKGMLIDEAKEHIDKEAEKNREAAKEKAEEKKELEVRIEKAKEEKKEKEKVTEEILEGVAEVVNNSKGVETAQQEVKDMMNKMSLIEDDIKGAAVDKSL